VFLSGQDQQQGYITAEFTLVCLIQGVDGGRPDLQEYLVRAKSLPRPIADTATHISCLSSWWENTWSKLFFWAMRAKALRTSAGVLYRFSARADMQRATTALEALDNLWDLRRALGGGAFDQLMGYNSARKTTSVGVAASNGLRPVTRV